ncbi:U3 small nucleolar RNA-associated protein 15 [Leucoagaricus sp. SymC.cos]|nr:U3 small nucleolar RNA-associated protein 15 [Leucoagaricus sp. SymC.cos]
MDFLPTIIKSHARPAGSKHTPESRYWRQYKHPVFIKEYAPVTSVYFSSLKPHHYAVTAATRVQIYAPRTQKIIKTISRFKDVARSGHIRGDGKLVVAGDDSGLVQVFDINSRAILRTLDSHKQPVHVSKFSFLNPTQVLTCSDDTIARVWDVPSQTSICTFSDHTDYVRTGQFSTFNPNLVLTGSYDATVRLFDSRTGECEMIMGASSPGSGPVEQVLMFPSGTAVVSSTGPIIRVWDIVAGGRCLRAISNHQKTVTALTFNADASRLLTGGLDHMVKVYDVSTYKVMHTMRYPAPILCLAVSPDETHIVGGMSDGTLSVRRRQAKPSGSQTGLLTSGDTLFDRQLEGVGQGRIKNKSKSKPFGDGNELMVERRRRKRLRDYDRLLKVFKYSAALDAVLKKNVPPTTTFSLIQELIHRDGLKIALSGRDDVLLEPILRLLLKHVTDPRFGELVCDVAGVVIEMYKPVIGQAPLIDSLFVQLYKKVVAELRFQAELQRTKGALSMIMSSSLASLPS